MPGTCFFPAGQRLEYAKQYDVARGVALEYSMRVCAALKHMTREPDPRGGRWRRGGCGALCENT